MGVKESKSTNGFLSLEEFKKATRAIIMKIKWFTFDYFSTDLVEYYNYLTEEPLGMTVQRSSSREVKVDAQGRPS